MRSTSARAASRCLVRLRLRRPLTLALAHTRSLGTTLPPTSRECGVRAFSRKRNSTETTSAAQRDIIERTGGQTGRRSSCPVRPPLCLTLDDVVTCAVKRVLVCAAVIASQQTAWLQNFMSRLKGRGGSRSAQYAASSVGQAGRDGTADKEATGEAADIDQRRHSQR